jgi:hypothetical protein
VNQSNSLSGMMIGSKKHKQIIFIQKVVCLED